MLNALNNSHLGLLFVLKWPTATVRTTRMTTIATTPCSKHADTKFNAHQIKSMSVTKIFFWFNITSTTTTEIQITTNQAIYTSKSTAACYRYCTHTSRVVWIKQATGHCDPKRCTLQGSVATCLWCDRIISNDFITYLLLNMMVKEVWNSVKIRKNTDKRIVAFLNWQLLCEQTWASHFPPWSWTVIIKKFLCCIPFLMIPGKPSLSIHWLTSQRGMWVPLVVFDLWCMHPYYHHGTNSLLQPTLKSSIC